jgi:methionyl aminopeptidase
MQESGRIVRRVLHELREASVPGISTSELDEVARLLIREEEASPSFLGYRGYPASVCISVNSVVVHGIPGQLRLKDGDLVSIDVGVNKGGYHGDAADSFFVGSSKVDPEAARLVDVTYESLKLGIDAARRGNRVGDIGSAVQQKVEMAGFNVVRDLVGHGIGRRLHEDPQVPNYGRPGTGMPLRVGMAIAIEPMVNQGGWRVNVLDDGWTIVTEDGSLSAHAEHTVVVTDGEPLVLTA